MGNDLELAIPEFIAKRWRDRAAIERAISEDDVDELK